MPLAVGFNLDLFHGEDDWNESAAGVADLLRASVRINQRYLRRNLKSPSPFSIGSDGRYLYRYLIEHANETRETFRGIEEIIEAGGSDCDGIVPWVVAWRRERENDPKADIFLQWKRGLVPGTLTYHVLEKNGRDEIGDPCRTLGMGQ